MSVSEAAFRLATPQEQAQAKGSWYASLMKAPFYYGNAFLTTLTMKRNAHNTLNWDRPLPQKIYDFAMHFFWQKPEYPCITERFSLLGTNYNLSDPLLVRRFFEFHRNGNDGLFAPNKSLSTVGGFLAKCFPGLEAEDFMGTCGEEQTKVLHGLLQRKLNRNAITSSFDMIRGKCGEYLELIARSDKPVNFSDVARLYNAEVFGQGLFDDREVAVKIGQSILEFKSYLIRAFNKALTANDATFAERMAESVRECTKVILESSTDIPLFLNSELTLPQKQAMIFLTLFAAQDNTTTLLAAMVAHLSKLDKEQISKLQKAAEGHLLQVKRSPFNYPKEITDYQNEVLQLYPPVPLVAKGVKNDICIDYKLAGDETTYTKFIPKGSYVAARMIDIGERFFGEKGPHTCPGKDLAKVETLEFFTQLMGYYDVKIHGSTDFHLESQVTANLKPDVMVTTSEN